MTTELSKIAELVNQMQRHGCTIQDEMFDKELACLLSDLNATNHDLLINQPVELENASGSIIDDIVDLVYPMLEGSQIHLGVPLDTKF